MLARIRSATEALPDRSALPSAREVAALKSRLLPSDSSSTGLVSGFLERWRTAGGLVIDQAEALPAFLEAEGVGLGYVDPKALELLGIPPIKDSLSCYQRAMVDEIQYGVTIASGGIAETGTLVLTDRDTPNRLSALAPWVHISVLRRADIALSVQEAVDSMDDDPSVIFVTGPSKTADIEGILIEGVHGPGRQAVLLV